MSIGRNRKKGKCVPQCNDARTIQFSLKRFDREVIDTVRSVDQDMHLPYFCLLSQCLQRSFKKGKYQQSTDIMRHLKYY
jgi:hypothetical protein